MPALPRPALCLVAGGPVRRDAGLDVVVAAAIDGGVNVVQLREKQMPARALLGLARRLREVCGTRSLFFVNDRVDVALASDADGVQLGEGSLDVAAARRICGGRLMIGRSVHSLEGAATAGDADLLVLGTIFPSKSHPEGTASGPRLVREVVSASEVPVVAIGGITPGNAGEVMEAGAAGVAVISAILDSDDPRGAASALWKAIDRR